MGINFRIEKMNRKHHSRIAITVYCIRSFFFSRKGWDADQKQTYDEDIQHILTTTPRRPASHR